MTPPALDTANRLAAYPPGLFLLVSIDFWERFSYYGMLAILPLFLTADPSTGGLGWSDGAALTFFGLYGGLGFALPLAGGWLADRRLGYRRAIGIGAAIMAAGHILLATAAFVNTEIIIFAALALVMAGNAVFKTPLIALIGELFAKDDPRIQVGYGLYYSAINAGALASTLVVGLVAQKYGWHAAFGAAGVGMLVALGLYGALAQRLLGERGKQPAALSGRDVSAYRLSADEWSGLKPLAIAAVLASIFAVGWFQFEGFWYLFVESSVDRTVGQFTIPSSWFLSLGTLILVIGTPIIAAMLARMNGGLGIAPAWTFAIGFLLCALAQCAGIAGAALAGEGGKVAVGWALAIFALTALAELILWPSTYALVYRYAPPALRATFLGAWLLTLAIGKTLAGSVGATASELGALSVYPWLVLVMLGGAIASLALLPRSTRIDPEAPTRA